MVPPDRLQFLISRFRSCGEILYSGKLFLKCSVLLTTLLLFCSFIGLPNSPTTKTRRGILDRNTEKITNDYSDDPASGVNENDESGSEDEEEAERAQETAKILAVSTVGTARRKSRTDKESNEQYLNDEDSDDEISETDENGSSDLVNELNSEEVQGIAEPVIENDRGSEGEEESIDTRSKVPTPRLRFYNGTNDFKEPSQPEFQRDSLGLTDINDIKEAHVDGPSAYYTMERNTSPEDAAQSRSYIEDPDTVASETSATEVNSLWNDAKAAEDKLANIPYPTDDSQSRLRLFMNEDGVNKGEPSRRKSLGEGIATEHKQLISDVMQNVNGGKTIGEKFANTIKNHEQNAETTSSNGIPVIRAMNTRKLSKSMPLQSNKVVRIGATEASGKKAKEKKRKESKGEEYENKEKYTGTDGSRHEANGKDRYQNHQDRETYHKLKASVENQRKLPVKNKTWEAEVNSLFPGKESERLVVPVDDDPASVAVVKAVPTLGKPSKKHSIDSENEPYKASQMPQRTGKQKPTSKETRTDNVQVSTKRQCLGMSITDCIGTDSVTFNLPLSGPGSVGVQLDNMRAPEIIYPPGAGFPYQNGFQPPIQYPPGMRQLPVAYPSSPNADMQQQYGGLQGTNGYSNQPLRYPEAFPDHYPNNIPNMPQSNPIENKNRPRIPTMKPSENSIYKGGAPKKKKKKHTATTPKPKKTTTTRCPDCDKTAESSGGKNIPFTGKLRKVRRKKTTTTKSTPKTTPLTPER